MIRPCARLQWLAMPHANKMDAELRCNMCCKCWQTAESIDGAVKVCALSSRPLDVCIIVVAVVQHM